MALDLTGFDPFYSPLTPTAEMVEEVLDELGWDADQAAVALKMNPVTVKRWLSGEYSIPVPQFYGLLFVRGVVLARRE